MSLLADLAGRMPTGLNLATPLALLALPLPLLVHRLLPPRPEPGAALALPPALLRAGAISTAQPVPARRDLALWLAAFAWLALVLALAGPEKLAGANALPASGRDLVLVLDLSGSMEARDFSLDGTPARRLDAVKRVAGDFLARRGGDRVGLVLFAEKAEMAVPPTFDLAAVTATLADTEIGLLGRSTAIGDGLGLAVKRLKDSPARSRVVLLLSDGSNTAGVVGAEEAARLAAHYGIVVHTLALGTDAGAEAVAADAVDTATLSHIAEATGGHAFRIRSTADLAQVATQLDAMETTALAAPPVALRQPLWVWPAAAALAFCLAALLIRRRPA